MYYAQTIMVIVQSKLKENVLCTYQGDKSRDLLTMVEIYGI